MADHDTMVRPLLGFLFRQLHQEHAQEVEAALLASGFVDIRPPHANVFPFVPKQGIQVVELAALAGVRKQTMAQSISELERAGYIERRPDPRDRRARLVFLTPKGEAVRPVAKSAGRRVEAQWARLIGREDLEHVRASLELLLERLRLGHDGRRRGKPLGSKSRSLHF
jgi:DNA-binding MarR family transcriptional regulator